MQAIVTRPSPEAQQWARRLEAAGVPAQALPLIDIAPAIEPALLVQAWHALGAVQAVMFVSGNAVRHFFAARPAGVVFSPRAWAPGPGTHDALLAAGVDDARIDAPQESAGQFDSEALWTVVETGIHVGDKALLVRGAGADGQVAGRDWLAAQLRARQVQVQEVVAYQRRAPHWTEVERALARGAAGDGSVWLFSSSEAIVNLRALVPDQDWGAARAIATHPRIAQAAQAAGFGAVHEARPAFDDVLSSLQSLQ